MATKKISTKKIDTPIADILPSEIEAQEVSRDIFAILSKPYLYNYINRLKQLKNKKPQVIIFEGATKEVRFALSKYWACLINCEENDAPCGKCATCLSILNEIVPDFILFDGSKESIKTEDMREKVVKIISQSSSHLKKRIFLFYEANAFTNEAANTLLKSFEEPNKTSNFILTSAQKDLLLPTIISRSLLFSLPLELDREILDYDIELSKDLAEFFKSGKCIFDVYTGKKEFDRKAVKDLLHILMLAINLSYSNSSDYKISIELIDFFKENLKDKDILTITSFIFKSLEMVENSTSPNCTLITESLLSQIYMILNS